MANEFEALSTLDRTGLIKRMAEELPDIRKKLNAKVENLADKIGMEDSRLKDIESGKFDMIWSEYMSILFVIRNNDIGRGIVESKGLFPDVLKKVMSANRNAHPPVTESAKFGF